MKKAKTIAMALSELKKTLLIMKLTLLFIIVCTMQSMAGPGGNIQTGLIRAEKKEIKKVVYPI